MKDNIKNCIIIYNPVSTGFNKNDIDKIYNTTKHYGLNSDFLKSNYQGNLIKLVKEADDYNTLIITLGGDGTVSEAYRAYNDIHQKGLYAHIPTGTTNDMAKNFDIRFRKCDMILNDILNGEEVMFDSYKMNDEIVAYTSVFGYLAHVPYVTSRNMKKYFGHLGYVLSAFPYIIKTPKKYNILYETDNNKEVVSCILGAITNSKGFAGIDLYKNASLNDGKLELLLVKDANPKLIASLVKDYLKNDINLKKYENSLTIDSSSKIKLTFNENYPDYPIDNDGEKSKQIIDDNKNTITYEVANKIKVLKRKIQR